MSAISPKHIPLNTWPNPFSTKQISQPIHHSVDNLSSQGPPPKHIPTCVSWQEQLIKTGSRVDRCGEKSLTIKKNFFSVHSCFLCAQNRTHKHKQRKQQPEHRQQFFLVLVDDGGKIKLFNPCFRGQPPAFTLNVPPNCCKMITPWRVPPR